MGSNGCKDMTLDGCVMSRFDAHCGVTNATITNCDLGFAGLNLIGFGECLIENTTIRTNTFIWLRADYGSFFAGKLTIRNCTHKARNSGTMCLIWAHNDGGHDFGYPCMMPPEIEIDGLTIDDEAAGADAPYVIFSDFDADYSEGKPYPYEITKKMTVRGIKRLHGTKIALAAEPKQFEKLILDYKK